MATEGNPNLIDLHRSFSGTSYGQALATEVRFSSYQPPDVSNEKWADLLGPDVNNLAHLPFTYAISRKLTARLRIHQSGYLTDDEVTIVNTAAITHDWAEAVTKDIDYNLKTEANVEEEKAAFEKLIDEHRHFLGDHPTLLDEAYHIIFNTDTKLGHVFNTVERIGYMHTAIKASRIAIGGAKPELADNLRMLAVNVYGNQLKVLTERATQFKPVMNFIISQAAAVDGTFEDISPEFFEKYDNDRAETEFRKFFQAKNDWLSWCRVQKIETTIAA